MLALQLSLKMMTQAAKNEPINAKFSVRLPQSKVLNSSNRPQWFNHKRVKV